MLKLFRPYKRSAFNAVSRKTVFVYAIRNLNIFCNHRLIHAAVRLSIGGRTPQVVQLSIRHTFKGGELRGSGEDSFGLILAGALITL
jgi:hypothetical protein